ncbi:MAG: YiiX/YebB-like N1pC/P60 family cysteine hydrolase, partial [Verrucomicrobia bacterium]|nr:YiiX/YebB-like N1pC/P60 family cysteine hydrolase [Verrucomicrobiota bacterium]
VIEAVAEGVIFSSLDHLLETHITRLVVLRPRLTAAERLQQLTTVFDLLGDTYDFKFDFGDASHHCCTEVIYRSLHNRGPIAFDLGPRMGKPTLSADDIIHAQLTRDPEPFEFVLLVSPAADNVSAEIRVGEQGELAFVDIMSTVSKD